MKISGIIFLLLYIFMYPLTGHENRINPNQDQIIEANNPLIQYTGRIDFSNPLKPVFWTPGSFLKLKFAGTYCDILLNDRGSNYIEVIVDDTIFYRIKTKNISTEITVVKELKDGEHTLCISKNTETNTGALEFLGVRCKKVLPLPEKPKRKLEFIGNSITCGTGSDLTSITCGGGEWQDQHNAYMAYGPLVARKLNAQWHLSSYSGIGLIKSCCGIAFTMPDVFDKSNLTPASTPWDFTKYIPDAVTISLGQNDGIQDSSVFCSAYIKFIQKIRGLYPKAEIICLTSPMADLELTNALKKYLTAVVDQTRKQGDSRVHKYFFPRSYNSGCDSHPTLKEHALIADELEGYLKKILKW